MRKKNKHVVNSLYSTPYRWSRIFNRYSLEIAVSVSHLTETRKAKIRENSEKIDRFLESLTIDDCFDIINFYKNFTRLIFTKSELEKCQKVEIYLLYFSTQQATSDPSEIRKTEAKSRIVTRYGRLKELCLYEPEHDELYHVWANRNWLWKSSVYQYSHQNNETKLIYDEMQKPDNPVVIKNYIQPSINQMLGCIDKFI